MAVTTTITNTTTNPLVLYYRASGKDGEGQSPLISVFVAPKALLQPVSFSDEASFNRFKDSNALLIEGKQIILGKATENAAIKENAATQETLNKAVEKSFSKGESVVKQQLGKKTKLNLSVEAENSES